MTSDDQTTVIEGSITAEADFEDVAAIRQAIQRRGFDVEIDFSEGSITVERGPDVEPGGKVQLSDEYRDLSSKEIIEKVRDEHSLDGNRNDDSEREHGRQELAEKAREAKRGDGQYEPLDADDATDQEPDDAESERSDAEDEPEQDDTATEADQAAEDSRDSDEQQPEEPEDEQQADEEEDEDEEPTKRERRIQRLEDGIEDGTAYTSDELAAIAYDKDAEDVKPNERAYVSGLRSNGDSRHGFNGRSDSERQREALLPRRAA